jgi:thiosulfate reductase cytochrome b subunit
MEKKMTTQRIYIFKRFERFWHWTQAALIIFMMLTGFEAHGSYTLFGWGKAAQLHTTAAWALVGLWVFAIFWHFTTGEWKQYIPTMEKVDVMLKYYVTGIFTDAPHPFRTTPLRKHNPLQRLAYLFVKLMINPLLWISGFGYLFYRDLGAIGLGGLPLAPIALVHTAAAFLMLIFFIAHVYLTTAGHTPTAHIKAMITGYEEVEEQAAAPAGK